MNRDLTTLECALLGLLVEEPRTGYGLRQVFASTPMAHYGDSPGAIYPALRRLEAAGLVTGKSASDGRGTRILRATSKGRTALRRWLKRPIGPSDVVWRGPELLLKFSFMEDLGDAKTTRAFLETYAAANAAEAESATAWLRGDGRDATPHARAAVQHGIDLHKAKAAWARKALSKLSGR